MPARLTSKQKITATSSLIKVNHHVWKQSENKTHITTEHILKVKEAFIAALRKGGVHPEDLRQIREPWNSGGTDDDWLSRSS